MGRRILPLALTIALCVTSIDAFPQASGDPEVAKGIQQVEQGDYDAAIFTLDGAVRRLAADPKRNQELSEAYLHLGIAFLGKGHEAAAKAKFREAVKQIKDLTLSPDKFAPRVIDLVEAAKAEAARPAEARPAAAAAPAKKGGSRKVLLIAGLGVVAAVGAAVALAGGGGDNGGSANPPATTPPATTPASACASRTGVLVQPNDNGGEIIITATQASLFSAQIDWTGTAPLPNVDMFINSEATGDTITTGNLVSSGTTTARRAAQWQGTAGTRYRIVVYLDEHATTRVDYVLSVSGSCTL